MSEVLTREQIVTAMYDSVTCGQLEYSDELVDILTDKDISGTPAYKVGYNLKVQPVDYEVAKSAFEQALEQSVETGFCKLTSNTQYFLNRCSAIKEWISKLDCEYAVFKYYKNVQVVDIVPGRVYFHTDSDEMEEKDSLAAEEIFKKEEK